MSMPVVLCTGGLDHKIKLWDAMSGFCIKTMSFNESQVNCLIISPDKKYVVIGGNPFIHVFDVNGSEDKPIKTHEGHTNNVTSLGFQPNQKWFYSSSEDGTIKVWDPRFEKALKSFDCGSIVNSVVLFPNQSYLISGDQLGCIKLWNLENGEKEQQIISVSDSAIRSLSVSSNGCFMCVGLHHGKVFVYGIEILSDGINFSLLTEFTAHESYLLKCVISPDTFCLATTSADKTVKIWNTSSWKIEKVLSHHQKWVWDCVFSADSVYLISVSSDLTGKLWDLRSGDVIRNYSGHNLALTCVAMNDSTEN